MEIDLASDSKYLLEQSTCSSTRMINEPMNTTSEVEPQKPSSIANDKAISFPNGRSVMVYAKGIVMDKKR